MVIHGAFGMTLQWNHRFYFTFLPGERATDAEKPIALSPDQMK
jgi:hypothetical protein